MAANGNGGKRGEEAVCREVSIRPESESASFEQVFWCAEKKTGVILRPQTPKLTVSNKKTAQNDVTKKICVKKNAANFVF